jgi:hypothetical protein
MNKSSFVRLAFALLCGLSLGAPAVAVETAPGPTYQAQSVVVKRDVAQVVEAAAQAPVKAQLAAMAVRWDLMKPYPVRYAVARQRPASAVSEPKSHSAEQPRAPPKLT